MTGPDGKVILPTGKKFQVEFCTVAHWKNGEIMRRSSSTTSLSLMQQVGLM